MAFVSSARAERDFIRFAGAADVVLRPNATRPGGARRRPCQAVPQHRKSTVCCHAPCICGSEGGDQRTPNQTDARPCNSRFHHAPPHPPTDQNMETYETRNDVFHPIEPPTPPLARRSWRFLLHTLESTSGVLREARLGDDSRDDAEDCVGDGAHQEAVGHESLRESGVTRARTTRTRTDRPR